MKTHIKIITISLLLSWTFMSNAQSKIDRKQMAAPFISKDVARVSNKEALMIHHFTIKSIGTPDAVISKEVRKERRGETKAAGNVVSKGYPDWVISKRACPVKKG